MTIYKTDPFSTTTLTSGGRREITIEQFKRWLEKFDNDGDGRISKSELQEVIRATGGWFSRWKAERGVRCADTNGNGFIDESEIINLQEFAQKKLGVRIVAK